jgi:hypothetical protein
MSAQSMFPFVERKEKKTDARAQRSGGLGGRGFDEPLLHEQLDDLLGPPDDIFGVLV